MTNEQEKDSNSSGNLEIVKSDRSGDTPNPSGLEASSNNTEIKAEENDARYDSKTYQLKSERLEKTLKECEQEILFLVDLLKNKIPKTDKKDSNE